jgi:hypothetical protein
MNLKSHCDHCGLSFLSSKLFGGSGPIQNLTIVNCSVQCPRCGQRARVLDGTYNFVRESAKAFKNANSAQLHLLREVARSAAEGTINAQEAIRKAEEVHGAFGSIVAFALQWGMPSLLMAFLTLYISWMVLQSSNKSSDEQLAALNQIEATMQQLYHAETISKGAIEGPLIELNQRPPSIHMPPPSRTPSGPNRKQRRRDASIARKPQA